MKILYYASVNSRKESGVLKKIYSQAAQWQLQGAEVILLTIGTAKSSAPLIAPPEGLLHNEVNSRIAALFSGSFFKLLNRCLTIFRVRKLIKIHSPDIIYMRDCIWFPFMLILFDCRIPVVMEINSLLKN